ncbi:MAG: hypothetical protein AAF654_05595 [Myxococcota bacterium]
MAQRVARLLFIIAGLILLMMAYTEYEDVERAESTKRGVFSQVRSVANEIDQLKTAPPKPLQYREKAVQDLLARMVDDTELLGSSVRFDLESQLTWQPIKYGVEKARIQMSTAALAESAMGFFAILWALIQERPVNIIDGTIRMQEETVSFSVTLELFGLQGGFVPR